LFPEVALPCWQKIGFPFQGVEPKIRCRGSYTSVIESVFIPDGLLNGGFMDDVTGLEYD
jgi:hypothetical protein